MKRIVTIGLLLFLLGYSTLISEEEPKCMLCLNTQSTILNDYGNFYSCKNLNSIIVGLGLTGLMANTRFDGEVQDSYQSSIRGKTSDRLSTIFKPAGNGRIIIPIYFGSVFIGRMASKTEWGDHFSVWGMRSLRTVITGAPMLIFLQWATGGSRPYENDSSWRFFNDDNGVSGHSFMGSVPFLTAAKMVKPIWIKGFLYAGSTLTGLSRINDNQHYFSQVFFGYLIGLLASNSVNQTENQRLSLTFKAQENSLVFGFSITF